ncbi:hypothetical protein Tco_1171301 [Tanacetum coccineum]
MAHLIQPLAPYFYFQAGQSPSTLPAQITQVLIVPVQSTPAQFAGLTGQPVTYPVQFVGLSESPMHYHRASARLLCIPLKFLMILVFQGISYHDSAGSQLEYGYKRILASCGQHKYTDNL